MFVQKENPLEGACSIPALTLNLKASYISKCLESVDNGLQKQQISDHATQAEFKDLLMGANSVS